MSIFDGVEIPSDTDMVFIDVGLAADCPNTIHWLTNFPKSFVFGFEPVKENCDRVLERIKILGFESRFRLFHCAVDDVDGEVVKDFHVTCNSEVKGDHWQSSLFRLRGELRDSMWVEKTVPTLCVNLKGLVERIDPSRFPTISVLKTDTQGNDLTIIRSVQEMLGRIEFISCESHTHNQYQREGDDPRKVHEFLTSNGFEFLTGDVNNPDHIYKRRGAVN